MNDFLFTYDLIHQTITDNSERDFVGITNTNIYKLGEIFINFINYDFSLYNSEREKATTIFKKINYIYDGVIDEELLDLIDLVFPHLPGIYYELSHGDSIGAIIEYLLDIPETIPYCRSTTFTSLKQFANKQQFDFINLQNTLKANWIPCLDIDYQPQLTSLQKYMHLESFSFSMEGFSFKEKTVIRHNYTWKEQVDFEIETYANKEEFTFDSQLPSYSPPDINANPNWKEREIEIIHGYTFDSPKEALRCEFLKMLELGIKIRKCAVCGKYFILSGHNAKCCDNLYEDTGLTCQQVFANRNYKNKRKENPIMKEYDKAYKRIYARYSKAKGASPTNSAEFKKWKKEALAERDRVAKTYLQNPSDDLINEFKKFLNNK